MVRATVNVSGDSVAAAVVPCGLSIGGTIGGEARNVISQAAVGTDAGRVRRATLSVVNYVRNVGPDGLVDMPCWADTVGVVVERVVLEMQKVGTLTIQPDGAAG